jgi:hypothetical protein
LDQSTDWLSDVGGGRLLAREGGAAFGSTVGFGTGGADFLAICVGTGDGLAFEEALWNRVAMESLPAAEHR